MSERDQSIIEHILMLTHANELKWTPNNSSILKRNDEQWFNGVCNEYELSAKTEKNNRKLFISIESDVGGSDKSLLYTEKECEAIGDLIDAIFKQSGFSWPPPVDPFEDFMKNTGKAVLRDKNIDKLLEEKEEIEKEKPKKRFFLF